MEGKRSATKSTLVQKKPLAEKFKQRPSAPNAPVCERAAQEKLLEQYKSVTSARQGGGSTMEKNTEKQPIQEPEQEASVKKAPFALFHQAPRYEVNTAESARLLAYHLEDKGMSRSESREEEEGEEASGFYSLGVGAEDSAKKKAIDKKVLLLRSSSAGNNSLHDIVCGGSVIAKREGEGKKAEEENEGAEEGQQELMESAVEVSGSFRIGNDAAARFRENKGREKGRLSEGVKASLRYMEKRVSNDDEEICNYFWE